MPNQKTIDTHYLRLAWMTAYDLSKDPTTKVGCVIVHPNGRQISTGYNGFPKGTEETKEKWERPAKYLRVIHAEPNSIINCPFDTSGCTIYITHQPCHSCLGLIINAGITRVVYNKAYDNLQHKDIWDEYAKLIPEITQIDDDVVCNMIKDRFSLNKYLYE
jgi:dCMP deaminase